MDGQAANPIPIKEHQTVQPEATGEFTVRTEPSGRYSLVGPEGDVITTSSDFKALAEIRTSLNGRPRLDLLKRRQDRRTIVSRLVRETYSKSAAQPAPVTYIGNELKNRRVSDAASTPVLGDGQGVLA